MTMPIMLLRKRKTKPLLLLLCSSFLLHSLPRWQFCAATDITWHANVEDAGTNDPAKTAPKSQRYWDENNIPKPDYAYTDAEHRARKNVGNVSVISPGFVGPVAACFVLGMVAGLYALYTARGAALGGIGGSWQTARRLGGPPGTDGPEGPSPVEAFVRWLRSAMDPPPPHGRSCGNSGNNDPHEKARQARLARFHPTMAAAEAEKFE